MSTYYENYAPILLNSACPGTNLLNHLAYLKIQFALYIHDGVYVKAVELLHMRSFFTEIRKLWPLSEDTSIMLGAPFEYGWS